MPVKNSPLIAQYLRVKEKVPDAILFFRLGDFYEMFFEDAETGSRVLDIQLTSRSKDGVPLCGVPYHSAQPYIAKLLRAGYKVAICEQSAAEGNGRGLMPRQIVRIITPGTVNEETVLDAEHKSFLLAVRRHSGGFALAAIDVSTGEFTVAQASSDHALHEEIARIDPREILIADDDEALARAVQRGGCVVTAIGAERFNATGARSTAGGRFAEEAALAEPALAGVSAAALGYIEQTFGAELAHVRAPRLVQTRNYLMVDEVSRRHLELLVSSDGARPGSLLSILDETCTAAGARTLTDWISHPLLDLDAITGRQDALEELFESDLGGAVPQALRRVGDLERLVGRVGSLRAGPRDCMRLGQALAAVGDLVKAMENLRGAELREIRARLHPQPEIGAAIAATLALDPPAAANDGGVIRNGFDPRVDELRALASDARGFLARLEARERERSKIPSLKVRYNQVFGYYIEVTKPHLDKIPSDFERKQTLVSAERFTTPELKELEARILSAESSLRELELQLFTKLLRDLLSHTASMQQTAVAAGELDAVLSLAVVARRRGYVRPQINSSSRLVIRDGRHPVLEAGLKRGEFVPNDLEADSDERQILLITGPNMAGKSTYLRQVALIVIMAQMGSFVPAGEASIGLVDRVFTRIGARDELRRGESTFMVEMRETARLLAGLTERSLLLLDEVGRGTSTFDGLAIAWAIAEYLHDHARAKVLFATHFHELTDLARERSRVINLSMAVREWGGEVIFLRRVTEGAANRSYGIEVARLAGLPDGVVARAREILSNLERGELDESGMPRLARAKDAVAPVAQMALFASRDGGIADELKTLEVDQMTPVEALNLLSRLVSMARRGS